MRAPNGDRCSSAFLSESNATRSFVAAVEDAITRAGDVIVDMAYWTATDLPPARQDRDRLAAADVYVLPAGFRYRSPVLDRPELFYTEQEFEVARRTRTAPPGVPAQ
jgi:hypothetical protein